MGSLYAKVPIHHTHFNIIVCYRWWVAANASQNSAIYVGEKIFTQTKLETDRLRNVFKFLLGNLPKDMTTNDLIDIKDLLPIDRYILHCLTLHCRKVDEFYNGFNYNKVVLQTQNFVASRLSAFYFDLVKDRLYCDFGSSKERKSVNTVLFHVLNNLQTSISPILPVLCREVSLHSNLFQNANEESNLLYQYSTDADWINEQLKIQIELLLDLKEMIKTSVAEATNTTNISTKDLNKLGLVFMPLRDDTRILENISCNEIKEIFQVSNIEICHSEMEWMRKTEDIVPECFVNAQPNTTIFHENSGVKVKIYQSNYKLCPRCRLYSCDTNSDDESLCIRCDNVLKM